jgi:hypothetical protein
LRGRLPVVCVRHLGTKLQAATRQCAGSCRPWWPSTTPDWAAGPATACAGRLRTLVRRPAPRHRERADAQGDYGRLDCCATWVCRQDWMCRYVRECMTMHRLGKCRARLRPGTRSLFSAQGLSRPGRKSRFQGARLPNLVVSFGPRTDLHIFHSVRAYAVWAPRSPVGRRSRSGWLCWWSVLPCWRRRGCTSWQMRSRVSGWARCEATRMRSTPPIQQRYLQDLDSFRSPDPYNGRRPRYPERLEWVVKREEQILVGNLGRRGLFRAKEGTH